MKIATRNRGTDTSCFASWSRATTCSTSKNALATCCTSDRRVWRWASSSFPVRLLDEVVEEVRRVSAIRGLETCTLRKQIIGEIQTREDPRVGGWGPYASADDNVGGLLAVSVRGRGP